MSYVPTTCKGLEQFEKNCEALGKQGVAEGMEESVEET